MRIYTDVTQLIGHTPTVSLAAYEKKRGLRGHIFAKLEVNNPAGSAKDRVALEMIARLEAEGRIQRGDTIIEPTSGNTGIGLAAVCAARGYRALIVMPENMSRERMLLIRAYGAKLLLTPASEGMAGAVAKAEELARQDPRSVIAGQFSNPANPDAHYKTTGPEIWEDMDGCVDAYVAGAGTGGTLCGAGRYLREKKKDIYIAAVEPFESPLLSEGVAGAHGIQGIGANFVPENMDVSLPNEIIKVKTRDALDVQLALARETGIFAGISSAAALCGATELAGRDAFAGKNIVVVFPDGGERYLSSIEMK